MHIPRRILYPVARHVHLVCVMPAIAKATKPRAASRQDKGRGRLAKRTAEMIDSSMRNLKRGKVSAPINLEKYNGRF